MLRLLGLALVAGLALPASAQTCAGTLELEFYDVDYESRAQGRYVIPVHSLDVTAWFYHGTTVGTPTLDEARSDPALTLASKESVSRSSRLYGLGTELIFATRCGLGLLHLEIGYWDETMTLDVYRPSNHVPLRLDAALPFRPGRYTLDLSAAESIERDGATRVYSAAEVRPAE